jgi:hypothetical protein
MPARISHELNELIGAYHDAAWVEGPPDRRGFYLVTGPPVPGRPGSQPLLALAHYDPTRPPGVSPWSCIAPDRDVTHH